MLGMSGLLLFLLLQVVILWNVVVLFERLTIVVVSILIVRSGCIMPIELEPFERSILFVLAVIDMLDHRLMQRVVTFVLGIPAFLLIAEIVTIH